MSRTVNESPVQAQNTLRLVCAAPLHRQESRNRKKIGAD
jgi:hypothetical protein